MRALTKKLTVIPLASSRSALPSSSGDNNRHRTLIEFEIILKFLNELKKPCHFRVDRM